MQREVIERVEGLVRRKQPNARPLQPHAALRKLLKGRTYDGTLSAEHMASYHEELVSFPDEDFSRLPQLGDVLGAEDSLCLEEGSELMLREVLGDCEVEVPYWDPKLKYSQKAYQKLVCRLHRQTRRNDPPALPAARGGDRRQQRPNRRVFKLPQHRSRCLGL